MHQHFLLAGLRRHTHRNHLAAHLRAWVGWLLMAYMTWLGLFSTAQAAPVLRTQVNQHGDFVIFGNTLAHDCAAVTPTPVVGTVGACGTNTSESAPDIYWQSDAPAAGQAQANTSITPAQARSTAVLQLPVGAQVTHAYLYWSATSTATMDKGKLYREGPR